MGDFGRLVIDLIGFLWPFRLVEMWERGGFYIFGRYWRDVGPGCYPMVPWFMQVRCLSVVDRVEACGRQDITLSDGSSLSFDATALVRIVDVNLALNSIHDCDHSAATLLGSIIAEKLAEIDAERLQPAKRKRVFTDLERWVDAETIKFGVTTKDLRFTSFVMGARVHRLLMDSSPTPG